MSRKESIVNYATLAIILGLAVMGIGAAMFVGNTVNEYNIPWQVSVVGIGFVLIAIGLAVHKLFSRE